MILVCATAHSGESSNAGSDERLAHTLGESHYSYQFVLEQFLPVLERLDTVVRVKDPATEVDAHFETCQARGESCVFLSFAPPQLTPLDLACPTVPVFAWEFPDIPVDSWGEDPRNSWKYVLEKVGRAVTHSQFSVDAVQRVLGDAFPIVSCPSPVWDRFQALTTNERSGPVELSISADAFALDTGDRRDAANATARSLSASVSVDLQAVLNGEAQEPPPLRIDGVVYTSVFNPGDFRKNWQRMVSTFCLTFRDTPDAVLLLKFVHWDHGFYLSLLQDTLYKVSPFRCRVIGIGGFLEQGTYDDIVRATTYTLNTSTGEGQCLPLMEFMSCGKPAIAPRHTAMLDYIDDTNGFGIDTVLQETGFPQDPRGKLLTQAYQFESASFRNALRSSYRIAKEDPERYAAMSRAAVERLEAHASMRAAAERMGLFLKLDARPEAAS